MKLIQLISLLVIQFTFFANGIAAPITVTISGKIEGQTNAKIELVYALYDKTYVKDSTYSDASGNFSFKGEFEPGYYIVYLSEIYKQIPFFINNEQQIVFTAKMVNDEPLVNVIHSEENKMYYSIIDFSALKRQKVSQLEEYYQDKTSEDDKKELEKRVNEIQKEVDDFLNKKIIDHPNLFVSKFFRSTQNVADFNCDEKLSTEKCRELKYEHYLTHFFDNIDFKDERMVRTNVLANKVNYFFDEYLEQSPENISKQVDLILNKKGIHPEVFKTLLIALVNKYAKSKSIGMDAVYVYLVDNYYTTGRATWIEADQKQKMMDNANRLRPILIGKKIENIKLTDLQTNMPFELYSLKSPRILLSASPNPVSNLPELHKVAKENSGSLKVIVVCKDNTSEKLSQYRNALSENGRLLPNVSLIALSDNEYDLLADQFNLRTGPTYLLDENFTILFKYFAMEYAESVLDNFK